MVFQLTNSIHKMKRKLWISLLLFTLIIDAFSQSEKTKTEINYITGSYLVSSYIWRGVVFDKTPNLQPFFYATFANRLKIGYSGSYNFTGTYSEPDFYVSLLLGNFSINFADYHATAGNNFLDFNHKTTGHLIESYLQWDGTQNLPLKLTASVMFFGADKKITDRLPFTNEVILGNKNNYSSYFEATYTRNTQFMSMKFTAGFTASESYLYGSDSFGFTNLSFTAHKNIVETKHVSLNIFSTLLINPEAEQSHVILGLSVY